MTSLTFSRVVLVAGAAFVLTGCASKLTQKAERDARLGVTPSQRVIEDGKPVPKGGGVYRVGKAYTIAGRRYVPFEKSNGHSEQGIASWYGKQFHGRLTANGEVYDMNGISAAHRTMPMPSYARVTNTRNGRSLIVRVNDRGPYHHNRVIDVSGRAAQLLDIARAGVGHVKVDYVGRAELDGSDDRRLEATLRMDGTPATLNGVGSPVMVASAPKPFVEAKPTSSPLLENIDEKPVTTEAPAATAALVRSAPLPMPKARPMEAVSVASAAPRAAAPVVSAAAAADELPAQATAFQAPMPSLRPSITMAPQLKDSAKTKLGAIY